MTIQAAVGVLSAPLVPPRRTVGHEIGGPDRQARIAAAQAAGAHAFIVELPEGYDTPIGNGGILLSPSQRLRLSVARLLASDPASVVLDNPTAGLDAAGEAAVLPGLEVLLRGREVSMVNASPAVARAANRAAVHATGTQATLARNVRPPAAAAAALRPDPALPGLRDLLDSYEMAPLLGRMLGEAKPVDVRVLSVRYKPDDNVVVQYAVAAQEGWATAVAYANARSNLEFKPDRARNRKLVRRVRHRTAAQEPLGYLPEVSALVQWLPLDIRLPLLSELGAKLSHRLTKRGLAAVDEEPELVRYWPRRRAVLRFGPHIIKVYREATDFAEARNGLRAAAALQRVHTAPYEASTRTQRVTVQGFIPGGSPSLWPRSSDAAGSVLADLHGDVELPLCTTTADDILDKSVVRAAFVADLLPHLREELSALLAELKAKAPSGLPLVTSHGNFHAGQLLAGPQHMSLIDMDRLCLAAPAYDVASFAAHVAVGRQGEMELVTATIDSLLAGYGARPQDLGWFLANCLLRRAPFAFRHQDEHWPQAAASLVLSARQALE